MQSCIKIRLKLSCIIGILPFEREKKQKVVIKLKIKSDEFLDYALLCKWLKCTYKKQKFELLEESLEFVANGLKKMHPALRSLQISITKPHIIKNARVSAWYKSKYTRYQHSIANEAKHNIK